VAEDSLPQSLQESVLTALCFDQRFGALIAAQVEPEHFDEGSYREIAHRVLEYRRKHGKPPSQAHLDDLFGDWLASGFRDATPSVMRRLLYNLTEQAKSLNAEYVADRVQEFIRDQKIKHALLRASARYQQGGEDKLPAVEAILHNALRQQEDAVDAGLSLGDTDRGLSYLDTSDNEMLSLGIPVFDNIGIGPTAREMLLYIAPKNTGKTWFCIHVGRQGIMHRHKVLHVTAETRANRVIRRYHQAFFSVAMKPGEMDQATEAAFSDDGKLKWITEKVNPPLDFQDPNIRKKLYNKIEPWGARFGNLIIKEYPTGKLTVNHLVGYLDFLEHTHNFVPTVLIVDSPDNFKIPTDDFRLHTQQVHVDLRGLAATRNLMVVATTQGNRASLDAKRVRGSMVSEAIGKVQTADTVLIYSQTPRELNKRWGRLSIEYARNAERGATVLLFQNYALGQYVLDSLYLENSYWDTFKEEDDS
jgi:hypothetical protein